MHFNNFGTTRYNVSLKMNFLAHAYLSFGHPHVLAGNMISDFIKGKRKFDYDPLIQLGISLHRSIDNFTDAHPVTHEARQYFRKEYGLYSGAFIDVVYDHFLATDKNEFSSGKLLEFSSVTYSQLESFYTIFPDRFRLLFPFMKQQNWLYHYKDREGIYNSFKGLVRRALYMNDADPAIRIFERNYKELNAAYNEFFPALKEFSFSSFQEMIK